MTSQRSCRMRMRKRKSAFVDIFRTTPPKTVCPNFYVLAHADGCSFSPQCSYCYLKSSFWYLRGSDVFVNTEKMVDEVRRWIARDGLETYMLNTGNLSDSLSFEAMRPLMARLVEVFREDAKGRPHTLLVVTKGGRKECAAFLQGQPCENVVISFSVNNEEAARKLEAGAAPVGERLAAAADLKRTGWRVRIRIDPMILGYDYGEVVKQVRRLRPERVTLGALRAEASLFHVVHNGLFDELERSKDPKGLSRYALEKRLALYRPAADALRAVCSVGLCEEMAEVWDALGLNREGKTCNCCV